jgi:hypothetical protein
MVIGAGAIAEASETGPAGSIPEDKKWSELPSQTVLMCTLVAIDHPFPSIRSSGISLHKPSLASKKQVLACFPDKDNDAFAPAGNQNPAVRGTPVGESVIMRGY